MIPTAAPVKEAATTDITYSSILQTGKWRPVICSRLYELQMGDRGLKPRVSDSKSRDPYSWPWESLFWHWESYGEGRAGHRETLKTQLMVNHFSCVLALPSQVTFAMTTSEARTGHYHFILHSAWVFFASLTRPLRIKHTWLPNPVLSGEASPGAAQLSFRPVDQAQGRDRSLLTWQRKHSEPTWLLGLPRHFAHLAVCSEGSRESEPTPAGTLLSGPLKSSRCGKVTVLKNSAQQSLELFWRGALVNRNLVLRTRFPSFPLYISALSTFGDYLNTNWLLRLSRVRTSGGLCHGSCTPPAFFYFWLFLRVCSSL